MMNEDEIDFYVPDSFYQIKVKDLELLLERAQECAEDLICEIKNRHHGQDLVTTRRMERELRYPQLLLDTVSLFKINYIK